MTSSDVPARVAPPIRLVGSTVARRELVSENGFSVTGKSDIRLYPSANPTVAAFSAIPVLDADAPPWLTASIPNRFRIGANRA